MTTREQEEEFSDETPLALDQATVQGQKTLTDLLDQIESRANDIHVPKGPWIVVPDDAEECGPHAHSGLAMILAPKDDAKIPWPPARLLEWPTAHFIAAARNDRPALVKALRRAVNGIEATLRDNGHLADGNNCTLIVLKRTLPAIAQLLSTGEQNV